MKIFIAASFALFAFASGCHANGASRKNLRKLEGYHADAKLGEEEHGGLMSNNDILEIGEGDHRHLMSNSDLLAIGKAMKPTMKSALEFVLSFYDPFHVGATETFDVDGISVDITINTITGFSSFSLDEVKLSTVKWRTTTSNYFWIATYTVKASFNSLAANMDVALGSFAPTTGTVTCDSPSVDIVFLLKGKISRSTGDHSLTKAQFEDLDFDMGTVDVSEFATIVALAESMLQTTMDEFMADTIDTMLEPAATTAANDLLSANLPLALN